MHKISFFDHVDACEYMGEENPTFCAWTEGHEIGLKRVAYANAHKAHIKALNAADEYEIEQAWKVYVDARRDFQEAYYC